MGTPASKRLSTAQGKPTKMHSHNRPSTDKSIVSAKHSSLRALIIDYQASLKLKTV